MPLIFRPKSPLSLPVDVSALQLDRLRDLASADVARLEIWEGNRLVPCGELFEVSGVADDDTLIWLGDCRKVKSIGAGLTHGSVQVDGDAGMSLGAGMTGGIIRVTGDAGHWVGAEMRGGRIQIHGNAGDHVGGSRPGSRRGMTGGEILIHNNAGHAVGTRMRRGLIAVGGSIGDGAGTAMIAGTILIAGSPGPAPGNGMKRGTILFLQPGVSAPSAAMFQLATTGPLTFIHLYLWHLRNYEFPLPEIPRQAPFRFYRGDLLELGLGEIICLGTTPSLE